MKGSGIFFIIMLFVLMIITSAVKPVMHKPFILSNPDFKISGLSHRPADLQSIQMFKIGDVPVNIAAAQTNVAAAETPIIQSDVKIIPSDFIQQLNNQGTVQQSAQTVDNSDKILEQVNKMLDTDITPKEKKTKKPKRKNKDINKNKQKNEQINNIEQEETEPEIEIEQALEEGDLSCPICEQLSNPKIRSELIAWNIWRSELQNKIMRSATVEAPYGTIFFFTFKVDNNRKITDIKVFANRPNMDKDIKSVKATISNLNGDMILTFPEGTNRKSVNFSGGFLLADYEQLSTPDDYKDFEYVQMH